MQEKVIFRWFPTMFTTSVCNNQNWGGSFISTFNQIFDTIFIVQIFWGSLHEVGLHGAKTWKAFYPLWHGASNWKVERFVPTGRWTDDEYGRRASLMESLSFFSIVLEILFDFPPVVLLILSLKTFQSLAATFADPWIPRGSAGSFKTLTLGTK